MTETEPVNSVERPVSDVVIEQRKGLSIVWLIPLVAALIGGWLAYRTITEQGPIITIVFETAAGLEAGKSKVKYKNVDIGEVDTIQLSDNLSHIIVTASLTKDMEKHLRDNTRFWVVRPRLGAGGVSGLETLVSGAYIEIETGNKGGRRTEFEGLEIPPVVEADAPGIKLRLETQRLGAISAGSPIYFRDLEAGEVLGYELAKDSESIDVHIFVKAPYHQLVRQSSRFWSAGGLEVSLDASGVSARLASLEALVIGGIVFDTPNPEAPPPSEGARFTLYESFASVKESSYTEKVTYIAYFDGSVRGLQVGAPIEFRGIKVGSVTGIRARLVEDSESVRIPVLLEIEPERADDPTRRQSSEERIADLFKRGLRARLETGSLLTGKLFVNLDFYPNSPIRVIEDDSPYPQFPTLPSTLDEVKNTAGQLVAELRKLPLDEIANRLLETLEGTSRLLNAPEALATVDEAKATLQALQRLVETFDGQVKPVAASIRQAVATASEALSEAEQAISILASGSPVRTDLRNTLSEAASAARSFRILADYLQRNPDALIYGKGASRR